MPRRAAAAAPKKQSYQEMAIEAISALKDRTGSSQAAIEKWIVMNKTGINYLRHYLRSALKKAVETGAILRHHQHANSYKLGKTVKPKKKAAAKKPAAAKKKPAAKKKKPAAKKKKTTKKKSAAKKKKPAAKKKKPATKKKATTKKKKTTTKKKKTTKRSRK